MTVTGISPSAAGEFPFDETPLVIALSRRSGDDRRAFTCIDYSADSAGVETTITWAQLAHAVDVTAARLAALAEPGTRVAILTPQDLSYVIGFLAAMRANLIAVPLFAPEVSSHGARLVGALTDCAAEVWVTAERTEASVRSLLEEHPVPRPEHIVTVPNTAVDDVEVAGPLPAAEDIVASNIAYLQYTSGSTRSPAGAVITHRALAANVEQMATAFKVNEENTFVGWIPFFHDMGLIQLMCVPAHVGGHSVFTTPFSFVRRPIRWLRQLADYPKTFSAAPNFAFEYAAKKVTDQELATLDLSDVHVIANGSEPVRASTIEAFAEKFAPAGFVPSAHRPSYGLAEATVFVSTGQRNEPPVITPFDRAQLGSGTAVLTEDADKAVLLAAAGEPIGQYVSIVDPQTCELLPDGRVGEIWINGANVADSYWQSPQRTEETFRGKLLGGKQDMPTERWLRTGDLGVFREGLLYITGRHKDLIIIDGTNHYPQDIETTTQEAHPAIRPDHVAAFGVENAGGEGVVVVAEIAKRTEGVDEQTIKTAVRKAVSEQHDLRLADLVLVQPGVVLRTSSGKIARQANKKRYLATKSTTN